MSLFEVPGWSVPSAPVSQANKKRKRPTVKDATDDADEAGRIHSAQRNIEKLMKSLGAGMDVLDAEGVERPVKRKREAKEKRGKDVNRGQNLEEERARKPDRQGKSGEAQQGDNKKRNKKRSRPGDTLIAVDRPQDSSTPSPAKNKKKQKQKRALSVDAQSDAGSTQGDCQTVSIAPVRTQVPTKKAGKGEDKNGQDGLTVLQAKMKNSLDGARFRWINEMLYKSDSGKARELMSQDPAVFVDYHTGFRHQVESWPTNPVSHYITVLSSYPSKTVIADLGCGDAALARALVPKGMSVLSFDLVSDDAYVIQADICSHVPLPGSEPSLGEPSHEGVGEGQIVDVVVCALSLMGTNWSGCVREAWRILRPGGELKIAEVTSRFMGTDEFTSFVSAFGFKLKSKDERNTHFTLFEFKKVPRKPKTGKEWEKLSSRGNILKPCEYKRR